MTFTTRFAPSPTGPLHLGHAYSALLAHDMALQAHGVFLLRIEDIDQSRARPKWETQIFDDLTWLGITWPTPVLRQSENMNSYAQALDKLWDIGLLYPCSCTRRDIETAASAPQEGVARHGPDGLIYPVRAATTTRAQGPGQLMTCFVLILNGRWPACHRRPRIPKQEYPRKDQIMTELSVI